MVRRGLLGLLGALAVATGVIAAFALAAQAGHFQPLLVHLIAARIGRPLAVGKLTARLLSLTPRLEAEQVEIGNPPWMPPGRAADIGAITVVLQMPWFGHRFGVASLAMRSANLYLARDESGRANWQWSEPGRPSRELHIVRSLAMPDAKVTLDDARRHLKFHGTVSAQSTGGEPFKLTGSGELNERAVSFEISGDALAAASHHVAYQFTFIERSSGTVLQGHGALPRPFDFDAIQAEFDVQGADLRDLYYLTGIGLINTGGYRLSGRLERNGLHVDFRDLRVTSGGSDARGSVSIDSTGARAQLDIGLEARLLRTADFGLRAAGRAPPPAGPPLLLSDAALEPQSLRRSDAKIAFRAAAVQIGRLSLENLAARGTLDRGVLTVDSLTAGVLGGELNAHGRMDANQEPPPVRVDVRIAGLELDRIHREAGVPAPAEGAVRAHLAASGAGSSVHRFAVSANGTLTVAVPHGTVRDSLAEITGMDLRGLGLLLAKDRRETELRCAAGVFRVQDGTLTVERLVADTDPVRITADGRIQLATESLDLRLRGEPKTLRLFHFRSPVTIKGTLLRPAVGIEARHLEVVAAGKAKDEDCAALMAAADSAGAAVPER
jgi:AsmA family protein